MSTVDIMTVDILTVDILMASLPQTFVTWDNLVTSTQRPFWEHQSAKNFKIMTWIQDLPHPC